MLHSSFTAGYIHQIQSTLYDVFHLCTVYVIVLVTSSTRLKMRYKIKNEKKIMANNQNYNITESNLIR